MKIQRINKACQYYPCHDHLEDCTFCYCPFYPCENEDLGEYIRSAKSEKEIWSCRNCEFIHKKTIVDRIFEGIKKNKEEIFKNPDND